MRHGVEASTQCVSLRSHRIKLDDILIFFSLDLSGAAYEGFTLAWFFVAVCGISIAGVWDWQ